MTQDLLDGLYEQLQDLNFYPFSLSWFGDPNLEAGDWIELQDTAGNTFKTPNLLYSLTFSGGVTATSKADTTVSASASFVYKGQLNQIVENIRQYLNASGQQVSEGLDEPLHPKAGDVWFKKSGPDTYIMMYKIDPETGIGSWVEEVSTKGVSGLDAELKAAKAKLNADILAAQANLATAQKDVAALQTKLATNDQTQAQLTKDLAANAQLVTANKQSVDATLATVNKTLTQAQTDTATAVKNADLAVANAQSAVDASGLATKTANAASDAASAAKTLATSTAASFATVQSQANQAVTDASTAKADANTAKASAAQAITDANTAKGQAANALGQANTAIGNAADALDNFNNLKIGGRNLALGTATPFTITGNGTEDNSGIMYPLSKTISKGTAVTVTFDITSTNATGVYAVKFAKSSWQHLSPTLPPASGTQHYSYNLVTNADYSYAFQLRLDNSTATVTISNFIISESSKEVPWSPAPEDVQQQITTNATKITANSKEIALAAKQSVVDTLAKQVTDNTSQLKLTATAASLEVTSKKVDTLSQTVTDQGAKLDLTATSAQLKVTENKVDALNKTVSDNSAQLKLTATSAALETQSKRVDTINGQVDTNTAGITAANGEIELKASNSRVDTLSNTVKQQGIDLKSAQGELMLKITQNDLAKGLDGYATETWASQKITATAQGWETQLNSVKAQYNDIGQSQGRNYIRNSRFDSGMDFWWRSGTSLTFNTNTDSVTNKGQPGLHIYGTTTVAYQGISSTINVKLSKGQKFVIGMLQSFDGVWTQGALDVGVHFLDKDDNILGQQWVRFSQQVGWNKSYNRQSQVYEAPVDCDHLKLMLFVPGIGIVENVYITEVSLTVGPTSFGWQPAPEDTATYTDAKVASLKYTVDGLTATFATQKDLDKATSDFKVTADGLNLITAATGAKGEKVTQVIADVNQIQTTMTGANGVTTRLQTLEGFQNTATSKITNLQTQQTTLAGQYTSLIESADNKVRTPWFDDGKTGTWNDPSNEIVSGSNVHNLTGHSNYLKLFNRNNYEGGVGWFSVTPGEIYYFSGYMGSWGTTYAVGVGFNFITEDGTNSWAKAAGFPENSKTPMSAIDGSITVPAGVVRARTWVQIDGPGGTDLGYMAIIGLRISKSASGSQITQLQDNIDLRVKVDNKVTAALSLSADGGGTVTIRGASLYVTAASHFDAASIQSAAIANLDASKITSGSISADRLATTKLNADNITSGSIAAACIATTALSATNITSGTLDVGKLTVKNLSADMIVAGTIDASKITVKNLSASNIIGGELDALLVNVKNLNASNIITGTLNAGLVNVIGLNAASITAGTITGANLAINLNTGQVTFQSGRIHSADNTIDINVDSGYMSVADRSNRVILKGGQLQFIQPQLFDLQTTPYLSISNDGVGSNWAGATIVGRDSIMLANSANVGSSILTWELGQNTFSGLISGKNSDGDWDPTIVGGAERGVVIVGGTLTDNPIAASSPYIRVGSSSDGQSAGNRVYVRSSYLIVPSIYSKTTGSSGNVVVLSDGSLHRSTSASKYKTMIERSRSTSMAESLIALPTAHWLDKAELTNYANGEQSTAPKQYFGMIAEDLAAAGLEELVVRGDTGELEGINYDRIAPALLPLLAKMKQEIEELKGEKSA